MHIADVFLLGYASIFMCTRVHVFVCLMTNERRIPQRQPLVIILWEAVPDVGTTTCNAYTLSRHSVGFSSHLSALSDVNTYTTHTHMLSVWLVGFSSHLASI